ncbi:MAG: GIY-YIG nuclease family protein [Candidatus Brennerbacteria bacterium]|nr:GIY-YIG nuclease family protein [Candidatus Brennerbacteria bacterium]
MLESLKNQRYYVGSTEGIKKRLAKHNRGEVKSTKVHRPWKVVYTESFPTRQEARRRELRVKSWKKREAIERLIGPIV